MTSMKWLGLEAVAALLVITGTNIADTGADTANGKLQERIVELEAKSARDDARIADLEARLSGLEAQEGNRWLTRQRSEEIRHLVQDVLADADTRASTLGAVTVGYDNGAGIGSADGNWRLRTNILMQQRLVLNEQSGSPSNDTRWAVRC